MGFTFQINDDVEWLHDEELLKKANENKPTIFKKGIIPVGLSKIVQDVDGFLGFSAVTEAIDMKTLNQYKLQRDESIILDLGDHYVGNFSIDIDSVGSPMDAPLYLKLKFAEVAAEIPANSADYDGWLSKSWIQEEYVHLDILPKKLILPRRYSCRYIEITVIDTSPKWQAVFSHPVFQSESSAETTRLKKTAIEDPGLARLYDVSVKTLQNCMQDVFEDGPKRDRRLWIGDLRLQALVNYDTFNQNDLVKRCMYLFAGMTTKEGKVAANVFTSPNIVPDDTFLFDYSIFFSVILYDYVVHTQDFDVLSELYDTAKKQMDIALDLVDEEGRLNLLEEWPVFIDWSNDFDKKTAGQATLIYSLSRFIKLAEKMNDEGMDYYQAILDKMSQFSREKLYDNELGLFVVEDTNEVNIASQAWMVLASVMDESTNKQIMLNAIKKLFPVRGIATPYMYHHIAEALLYSGLVDEGTELIKNYWGEMLDLGADTFWEAFKPEDLGFSPYDSPIISSFCHAWSCTPAYLISKYL